MLREHAVKQLPARRWLGLTATPYRRDKLDDLIAMQVGPVRHTIALSRETADQDTLLGTGRPSPCCMFTRPRTGTKVTPAPLALAAICRHLTADEQRTRQVIAHVVAALSKDRNCLILTNRTSHLERFAGLLRETGHDPVILRDGIGAKSRAAALARLQPQPGGPPLLAVATGPYAGEGFDCPTLDTLFLAAPVASKDHSRLANLKEMRPGSACHSEIRILYVFDPRRNAVLLVAGDKAGKWEAWYRQAIPLAEQRYEDYLKQEGIR